MGGKTYGRKNSKKNRMENDRGSKNKRKKGTTKERGPIGMELRQGGRWRMEAKGWVKAWVIGLVKGGGEHLSLTFSHKRLTN